MQSTLKYGVSHPNILNASFDIMARTNQPLSDFQSPYCTKGPVASFHAYHKKKDRKLVDLNGLNLAYHGFFKDCSETIKKLFALVHVHDKRSVSVVDEHVDIKGEFLNIAKQWFGDYQSSRTDTGDWTNRTVYGTKKTFYLAFKNSEKVTSFRKTRKLPPTAIVALRLDVLHDFLCWKVERIFSNKETGKQNVEAYLQHDHTNIFVDYCKWFWHGNSTLGIKEQYKQFPELVPFQYNKELNNYPFYSRNGTIGVDSSSESSSSSSESDSDSDQNNNNRPTNQQQEEIQTAQFLVNQSNNLNKRPNTDTTNDAERRTKRLRKGPTGTVVTKKNSGPPYLQPVPNTDPVEMKGKTNMFQKNVADSPSDPETNSETNSYSTPHQEAVRQPNFGTPTQKQQAFNLLFGEFVGSQQSIDVRKECKKVQKDVAAFNERLNREKAATKNTIAAMEQAHAKYKETMDKEVEALKQQVTELKATIENGKKAAQALSQFFSGGGTN